MPYKLVGKVPAYTRRDSTFDIALIDLGAHQMARECGGEKPHYGTPKYDIGHVVRDHDEMLGRRRGVIGRVLDFVSYWNQFRNSLGDYEWGVWVEVKPIESISSSI